MGVFVCLAPAAHAALTFSWGLMADQKYIDLANSTKREDIARLLNARLLAGVDEAAGWAQEAQRAYDYYASHQFGDLSEEEVGRIMPFTANIIRRDVDQIVARILDAEPVVNPRGRHESNYDFGKVLVDVLQWTRDEEQDWFDSQEDVVTDMLHTGEGILMETWDPDAMDGLGMPKARHIDPRFCVWDPGAREWQRQDGAWVIYFEPVRVSHLQKEYNLKDVTPDYPSFFIDEDKGTDYTKRRDSIDPGGQSPATEGGPEYDDLEPMAYKKVMYEKKIEYDDVYYDDTGQVIQVTDFDGDGELRPLTRAEYSALSDEEKEPITKGRLRREELWETIVINDEVVHREISIYDKSRGGHGLYPFAFFTYVRLRGRSHGKGEIDYLIGPQDLINRTLSRWLEQLMVAGSNFVVAQKGSLPRSDEEKLRNIGRKPMQVLNPYPGFAPPTIQGANPTGASLFASGYSLLQEVKDKVSGIYDVHRGDMPYQTSGRGIRALQSQADLLGTMPRRHIESGLQMATYLRLSNIVQYMRGTRIAEVTDVDNKADRTVYIGQSISEIEAAYGLRAATEQQTGLEMRGPNGEALELIDPNTGEPAQTIILTDETGRSVDLSRIRFELDTGKERNRQERMDFAEMVMQNVGAPAVPWALELLDAPNKETLLQSMEDANSSQQLMRMVEEAAQAAGMDPGQLMQQIQQQLSMLAQGPQDARNAQGPAQGQGAPQAPPQAQAPA